MSEADIASKLTFETLLQAAESIPWNEQRRIGPQAVNILRQVHAGIDGDDSIGLDARTLAYEIHALWRFGDRRGAQERLVRLRRITPLGGHERIVLDVIGEDMAFLVGSVLAACRAAGADVLIAFHPIIETGRTEDGTREPDRADLRESYIQVHLRPMSDARAQQVLTAVHETLADVKVANTDFHAMRDLMLARAADIEAEDRFGSEITRESADFLRWLASEHFTFLGAREIDFRRTEDGALAAEEPDMRLADNLGVLRDPERFVLHRGNEPTVITPEIQSFLTEGTPIVVSKSNMRSRVHRQVYADYIGVKRYDDQGRVIGETRFVGLFTSESYNRTTREIPLIRRKAEAALLRAGKRPGSHDYRVLQHILETYPRDELFQIDEKSLLNTALGILHLEDHPRTRLFVRRDRFGRYVSALVFVPREVFNSQLRERIGNVLVDAYDGRLSAFYPTFGDAPLARIHYIIGLDPDAPDPDVGEMEEAIVRLSHTWSSRFRESVRAGPLTGEAQDGALMFADGFTAAYREEFQVEEALEDIRCIAALSESEPITLRAWQDADGLEDSIQAKVYTRGKSLPLSDCVPIFENMGLFVDFETGYRVTPSKAPVAGAPDHYWVHHFSMRTKDRTPIDLEKVGGQLERAFPRIWTGESENDGFNRLIMSLGASWREAALIRALCRYRKQTGLDPAQGTQILALSRHTQITALILDLFTARFDPDSDVDLDTRQETCRTLMEQIETELEAVESLDEDRVLRRIATLIMGILRTNFYQRAPHETPGEVITFKIAPRELDYLPNPRPYREIFVWAPHVEGVHLRFGPVARGGLRWSDRRDDFRTEVLGLVKAQQVKNAVIVPVGSKGGFVPKKLPAGGDRDAVREEGIRAYKTFITGLLRLTDNLVDGKIVQPKRVVCWDDPDPYLVVAADKGTATFSDIANGISLENGFWLGDAFASGGSAGYDHKKMGITARGGWVAVQRHFRERGKDIQTEPFNVVGVGDMSGDVFGNGMLLSKTIRLVAAFNHLDVFIDPDPIDAARNWEERKRLFDLPRSSWQDYDQSLISKGGGVFSRSAKSIPLSPEIKALTGLEADRLPPNDLIRALLKLDVELLWFGGIGTYVKARSESHLDVGDKANDGLRVDAADLSARVIGEGANLGITQAARIEFARAGGAVNTDAVDNSAGVDSSDHEVNIKILLADAIRNGNLAEADRNDLLAEMTDDVAAHVLANNYSQTAALSVAVASAGVDLDAHQRFMERLERTGELDRVVEGLPGSEEVRELRERGLGLSRPEIAVLLAYAKNTLFDQLIETDIPDDPHFEATLRAYFPEQIHRFETALGQHRLRREIICTYLVNRIINLGGPTFVHRVQESADASVADIARAFETARVVFRTDDFLRDVNALDNQAPAAVQTELKRELIRILRRQAFWLARTRRGQEPVGDMIARYQGGIDALKPVIATSISAFEQDRLADRQARFEKGGAPTDIAREAATLQVLSSATDLVDLSEQAGLDVVPAARAYHLVGARCHFDVLRAAAGEAASSEHWDRLATRRLIEDLLRQQFDVTHTALMATGLTGSEAGKTDIETVETRITDWLDGIGEGLTRLDRSVQELEQSGSWTFAKLVLVSDSIRIFVSDLKAEGATP